MTDLQEVLDLMMPLIPDDIKTELANSIDLAKRGTYEMVVSLGLQDYSIEEKTIENIVDGETTQTIKYYIEPSLTMGQTYLAAHFAYRAYLLKLKDSFTRDAINFSTLTFSIKGLEKRPEAINDSLYTLNRYLDKEIAKASGSTSVLGTAVQYGSE